MNSTSRVTSDTALVISLCLGAGEPVLASLPVTDADLAPARGESWLRSHLRQGAPDAPWWNIPMDIQPIFKDAHGPRCSGFAVQGRDAHGALFRFEFSSCSLEPTVERLADQLLNEGALNPGQEFYYELTAGESPVKPAEPARADRTGLAQGPVTYPALSYLELSLGDVRSQAVPAAGTPVNARDYPVFYTGRALDWSERYSRRGAGQNPPVETGAVLIGALCSCPDSGEFFTLVFEALEIMDGEHTTTSLNYTGASWHRIQVSLKQRQQNSRARAHRMLGQSHGHNFLPGNGKVCENCHRRAVCDSSSALVSCEDRRWMRAVFGHQQPWALCHIFGYSARGDLTQGLFGLRDGRWLERGYQVIPEPDAKLRETLGLGPEP